MKSTFRRRAPTSNAALTLRRRRGVCRGLHDNKADRDRHQLGRALANGREAEVMTTHRTKHLKANEFRLSLDAAGAGSTFLYAVGFIAQALHEAKKDCADLKALQEAAHAAYERKDAWLTQKRLAPFAFEYRATRRSKS